MKVEVEYLDRTGLTSTIFVELSLLAFLKHAATAGKGNYLSFPAKLARGIGALMYFHEYFDFSSGWSGFRPLPPHLTEPTDAGDFSTIAGRAIGDFLAKSLLDAKLSFSYEAAMTMMGFPLVGGRPDLYCVTNTEQFALEAKGYSRASISAAAMAQRKLQAQSGPIPVGFAFASVAYNFHGSVKCKFHDPIVPDTPFNERLNSLLAYRYYEELFQQASLGGEGQLVAVGGDMYYSFPLEPGDLQSRLPVVSILLPRELERRLPIESYLRLNRESFIDGNTYIDVDGIGLQVSP
ncbi:hypothetical protein [Ideonella margarita]|uniref:Restriction endonuclease n=1 Tax=Ideonella margarita TaxID=2984191 RepID=A0ABU9C916_9BURK